MNRFAVMVFPDERQAYQGLRALQELHAEGTLTVRGTDVIQRGADGRASILKRNEHGPLGTGLGALVGGLVGGLGGPVGATVGVALGAAAGGMLDLLHIGVSDEFRAGVERDLVAGKVAVVAEISEDRMAPLDARMAELGARVVREDRLSGAQRLEQRVAAWKTHRAEVRAERARLERELDQERAGTRADHMMHELVVGEIEGTRRRLEGVAQSSGLQLEDARQELEAKIEALLAQASGASPEVRARIDERIARLRGEFADREQKLVRALELTRQALQHP